MFGSVGDVVEGQIGHSLATIGASRGGCHIYLTKLGHGSAFATEPQNPEPAKR